LMMSTINNSILRHHLFAPSPILVATTQTQQLHIRRIFQHVTRCTFILCACYKTKAADSK
jgi:hypothetical protein